MQYSFLKMKEILNVLAFVRTGISFHSQWWRPKETRKNYEYGRRRDFSP